MIKQTETAEFLVFDRNQELNHRLSQKCAAIDQQMEHDMTRFRNFTADAYNFIHDVRRSTGYFLPAWYQEERTRGIDEMEAKRRAAEKPVKLAKTVKIGKLQVPKYPVKLKPILKTGSEKGSAHHVVLVDSMVSEGSTLAGADSGKQRTLLGALPEKAHSSASSPKRALTEITAVAMVNKSKLLTKQPFASLADGLKHSFEGSSGDDNEATSPIPRAANAQKAKKGSMNVKAEPSERLFERMRTMSLAKFNRILDEVDSMDITKWLPDYGHTYANATRLGPSLLAAANEHELDAEDLVDVKEMKMLARAQGLTGQKARFYLTRMFSRRHRENMQRPNFGLRGESDSDSALAKDLDGRMEAFRQHYPTVPELLMTVAEEKVEASVAEPTSHHSDEVKLPQKQIISFDEQMDLLRERTKLPFLLPSEQTSANLLPKKFRKKLHWKQIPTLAPIRD